MVNRNLNDQNLIYGSLTRAWAIQLLETLESHFSWTLHAYAGDRTRFVSKTMKAYVKQEDANEDRFKDRNNARDKNGYCCKAHTSSASDVKDKRINVTTQLDKAARKMDEHGR